MRAVNHLNGPCLVLAGPGSGKTFTLVKRIIHMIEDEGISDNEILVITFSKKSAVEMSERFSSLTKNKPYSVCFGTFHAIFYSIVKEYAKFSSNSILKDSEKKQLIKRIFRKIHNYAFSESDISEIIELISERKCLFDNDKTLDDFCTEKFDSKEKAEEFNIIFDEYTEICQKENKLDFDDMLYKCRSILNEKKDALLKYQNIYKYILVDEFQDINKVQYDVLQKLAGNNKNIFAVGDDDQAIYGFRGSRPELMTAFISDFENCEVIDMNKNYRCPECVIDAAGKIISKNKFRISKNQIACKKDRDEGNVYINICKNAASEADFICDKIKQFSSENYNLSDICIIFRTYTCVGILQEKLNMSGIPYDMKNIKDNYYCNDYIKDIFSYIKIALDLSSISNEIRILNKPERNLIPEPIIDNNGLHNVGDEDYKNLYSKIKLICNMDGYAAVSFILKGLKYELFLRNDMLKKGINENKIEEFINDLFEKARMFSSIKEWLLYVESFVENNIPELKDSDKNHSNDTFTDHYGKINMLTAHASKGLEFETVFIAGLQEGIFPSNKAKTAEQLEEERRLMYVAMTRAKRNLYIIGRGEEMHGKKVSRFVEEVRGKTD